MPIARKFARRKREPKPKKPDDRPLEVVRTTIKPSDRARMNAAEEGIKAGNDALRQLVAAEASCLYRVFNRTVQRMDLKITSLSSWAAFILVCDADREAVGWFGDSCSLDDRSMAVDLGLQVMRLDLRRYSVTNFPSITEGNENPKTLRYIASQLWSDEFAYRSKQTCNMRKRGITNVPVSIGVLEKNIDGSLSVRDVALANPGPEGEVPRLSFVPIEIDTIAVVNHGMQWDIWVSRGVSTADEANAKASISRLAISKAPNSTSFDSIISNQYVRVVRQGCERVLFRQHFKFITDFEPEGKCVPWAPPEVSKAGSNLLPPSGGLGGMLADPLAAGDALGGAAMAAGGAITGLFSAAGLQLAGSRPAAVQTAVPIPVRERSPWALADAQQRSRVGEYMLPGSSLQRPPPVPGVEKRLPFVPRRVDNFSLLSRQSRTAGRDMLTEEMMRFVDTLNVSPEVSSHTVGQASLAPAVLLGWQIEVDEGQYRGLFVVTGLRKTVFQKSQFRLSNEEGDDLWVKLKRGGKNGVRFRALRRVVEFQAGPMKDQRPGFLTAAEFDSPSLPLPPPPPPSPPLTSVSVSAF